MTEPLFGLRKKLPLEFGLVVWGDSIFFLGFDPLTDFSINTNLALHLQVSQ